MAKARLHQAQFHRSQIGRAQRYMRLHFGQPLTLTEISRQGGSSSYHFARLFLAYTTETPFEFLRRVRMAEALRALGNQPQLPITQVAMSVGYETPSAFNKAFRKVLHLSPSDFRKLGKARQDELIYDLIEPRVPQEIQMNLTSDFKVIARPATHFLYLETHGPFPEVAPLLWNDLFPLLNGRIDRSQVTAYLGLSTIDASKHGAEAMIYDAGVGLASAPSGAPGALRYREIPAGEYARFTLKGPYSHIWPAFNQIFQRLADGQVVLRREFCIENYLNDPKTTPEDQLLTELLVPVA